MASTISDFLLRVRVQGQDLVDKLNKSVNDTDKGFGKASTGADKFGKSMKDLGGVIAGSMGSGIGAIDSMASALGGLGRAAGGVALVATAFVALGMRAMGAADQIQDLSDATGISAGRLLNLKQSILEAGGRTEDFEKISTKLNQTLGEAANGNEKVRKSFRDLGVGLGDANGNLRSTDDLLPEVLQALASIPDPATRAATAVELLGKSANKIDWTKVSAGRDLIKDAEIKALADYRGEIDKLANTIETKLITAFGSLAQSLNKTFGGPSTTMEKFKAGLYSMLPGDAGKAGIEGIKGDIRARMEAQAESARLAGSVAQNQQAGATTGGGQLKITEAGMQAISNAKAQTEAMRQTNDLQNQYATKLNETLGMQQHAGELAKANLQIDFDRDRKIADINKQIQTETNNKERDSRVTAGIVAELNKQIGIEKSAAEQRKTAKQDELNKLQQQRDLVADIMLLNQTIAQDAQVKQLGNQNSLIGLYGVELQKKQAIMAIDNERTNQVIAAENKLRGLGKNATDADIARANQEIAQAKTVADAKLAILSDQLAKEKALRENAAAGAEQALAGITKQFEPFSKAQMQVNSMWGTMSGAIDSFVDTGKFKFGDFAKSIIQDLIKIELKSQASKLFSAAFGSGGFLGSLLGFANGGNPPINKPSIVGEKGPELFVPKTAGTIIPNGGFGGGSQPATTNVINNYNISAIDSRSVAQFFAENRRTMLGTMQLAQKELPYGNR